MHRFALEQNGTGSLALEEQAAAANVRRGRCRRPGLVSTMNLNCRLSDSRWGARPTAFLLPRSTKIVARARDHGGAYAPDYMEGVINLRGKIVSVIDLRKAFGDLRRFEPPQPHSGVKHGGRLSGLIVDSASEVIKIPGGPRSSPLRQHCKRAASTA